LRVLRRSYLLLVLALPLAGCLSKKPDPSPTKDAQASSSPSKPAAKGPELFGEKLTLTERSTLATVLDAPDTFKDKRVLVEGEVRRACSKKGCWMELATEASDTAPGCRVTFKDYGFFVPTNSAGSHALVEGSVDVTIVPKSRVDHLEAEGARFKSKNPDGTANEVRLVATGVELTRPS
jgi:hypothetical protein